MANMEKVSWGLGSDRIMSHFLSSEDMSFVIYTPLQQKFTYFFTRIFNEAANISVLVVGWYQILHGASPYLIQTPTLGGGAIGAAFKRGMEKGRMHEMV